jgi:hypothetical protein
MVVPGLSPIRRFRHFEPLKSSRRSFTAFRMTLLFVEDDGVELAPWAHRRQFGS